MLFDQNPTRCRHNALEPKSIDHFRIDYYCKRCGELVCWTEDISGKSDAFISGTPRKLTNREKMALR